MDSAHLFPIQLEIKLALNGPFMLASELKVEGTAKGRIQLQKKPTQVLWVVDVFYQQKLKKYLWSCYILQ